MIWKVVQTAMLPKTYKTKIFLCIFSKRKAEDSSHIRNEVFLLVPLDITSLILFLMEKGKKPVSHLGLVQLSSSDHFPYERNC